MSTSQHTPQPTGNMEELIRNLQQQIQQLQLQVDNAAPQIPVLQNAAPIPRIKPERPSPFTGRKSESLEAWIFQMQQFCNLAPVPEEDRIQFATTFFKDQAALWWRHYHQGINWEEDAPDWTEFLATLHHHFIPVNTSINAYDCLQ